MGLHLHLLQAQLLVSILLIFVPRSVSTQSNFQIAKPNCTDHCGNKALSYDRPEEDRSLANYFLSTLKQSNLFQVLDDNIVCEGSSEELTSVAMLAKSCLHVKGEDRPSMKEVAMELEGLRLAGKHSWNQTEPIEEESESLLSGKMNAFAIANGEGSSTAIGYESMRDHIILPMGGGR
ncbi:unnamed protein product [Fraxinus pennsylvanica]|uniref:Uncharacterized protein n=1 Tax=Fraxinus pennsylvanica TaxID=56036 RepID=A0AAD1ZYJ9_9LAMI|nr:unnamed protein product [Fraxinus pennsylvanica]